MNKRKIQILSGFALLTALGAYAYYSRKGTPKSKELDSVSKKILEKFSASNKKYLDSLNPSVKQRFKQFIDEIISMGYAVVITSAYRSSAEQAKQKKANPKNAAPGYSTHEYGIGIDLNLVKGGKWINKETKPDIWKRTGIVDLGKKKYGFNWGGEFKNYYDPVHFDDGKRFKVPALYAKALKIYGSPEKIQGNKMNLT